MGEAKAPRMRVLARASEDARVVATMGGRVRVRWVSEGSVRRALAVMVPAASQAWMRGALMSSVRAALEPTMGAGMNASGKPLYGHREGAQVSDNPLEPGRPRHVLRTVLVSNLGLALDTVLGSGKQHTQDMRHSELTARAVALGCTGWGGYARAARPQARRPEEARATRVLRELVKNQRLG